MYGSARALATALLLTLAGLAPGARAMEIRQFDKLAGPDQIEFIDQLAQSVQDASHGELALRVKYFFQPKHTGESISGMGRFELNLALARIADIQTAAKNPRVRRLEVEDVMYTSLESAGLALDKNFRPSALNFKPKHPLMNFVMTEALAQRGLAETQEYLAQQRFLDPTHGTAGVSSNQRMLGFFGALMALALAADHGSGSQGSSGSSGSPQSWWQQDGYNSYHDAVHATCLTSTTSANPTWCN